MKHFIIAAILAISASAHAEVIKITESSDGESWYVDIKSFATSPTGGLKMSVERRTKDSRPPVTLEVTTHKSTCENGKGELHANDGTGWWKASDSVLAGEKIGDHLARGLCIIFEIAKTKKYI